MKSKVKKLEGTARQLEIEMPKESIENSFNKIIEEIRKTANIPGFRPGKAPLDLVEKKHNGDAMEEVKRQLVPQAYQQALEEQNINPLSYPELSDINISLGGILTFKAKVDMYPKVKLCKYKNLKVETSKVEVSDKEGEEALNHLVNINAEFVTVDGALKKGDFGICDVETFIDGKVIAKKRENMWIEVDKEASMLGMGEDLCGLKPSDEKDIDVELPENYPDKRYAGKKAVFHVKVKEVKERKLPKINEEFAKKLGKNDIKSVREKINSQLKEKKEVNERINIKNQIMEQLIDKHKFDMPHSMVKRQLKVLLEKAENELIQKGVDKNEIETHKEQLKDKLQKEAEDKVRVYFILDEIAKQEKIEVNDEEIDNWLKNLAASYNQPVEDVKKYYEENSLIGGLEEHLREDKTLDFLVSEADVKEKR